MSKTLTLMYLILLCFIHPCFSQDDEVPSDHHFLGLYTGLNSVKEEILIPKVNRGLVTFFTESYERDRLFSHNISFSLGFGALKTALETEYQTLLISFRIDYSAGYRVLNTGRLTNYAGLRLDYSLTLMEFPVWDESRAYWSTSLSIGPWDKVIIDLGKDKKWITTLALSSPGIVSRPDEIRLYAQEEWTLPAIMRTTHSDFRAGFISSILIANISTEIRVPAFSGHNLSIFYDFYYSETSKASEPSLYIIRNSLGLRLNI